MDYLHAQFTVKIKFTLFTSEFLECFVFSTLFVNLWVELRAYLWTDDLVYFQSINVVLTFFALLFIGIQLNSYHWLLLVDRVFSDWRFLKFCMRLLFSSYAEIFWLCSDPFLTCFSLVLSCIVWIVFISGYQRCKLRFCCKSSILVIFIFFAGILLCFTKPIKSPNFVTIKEISAT